MTQANEPVGTVQAALAHAVRLLQADPALAVEQATEILRVVPGHPGATLVLGAAHRARGDDAAALAVLEPLAQLQPKSPAAHYELALTLGSCGRGEEAVRSLRRALELNPELGGAWRALGDHLTAVGDTQGADEAYARHIKSSTRDPRLMSAAAALVENKLAPAEALLREHLMQFPTDVAAIRMLAEVAARLGRYGDAENLLNRCLELAPGFTAARHNYAVVLHRQIKTLDALREADRLLEIEPRNPGFRTLKAGILVRIGEYARAIELYGGVLGEYPNHSRAWLSYGHALKTAGRQEEGLRAYRKTLELKPEFGEAWWSLANLKTLKFTDSDVEAMRERLEGAALANEDRWHFHFALGKALEDRGDFAASFDHYARGNSLRREAIEYDPDETTANVRRSKAFFSREFFAARAGQGCQAPDPIFILGLPRAGSTLVEQILSSHPEVEGTQELPDMAALARRLSGRKSRKEASVYPEVLQSQTAEELRALGEEYLARARIYRKTSRPYFIDKLPNNWPHVGLIHLVLPNAKIIDARRHPLGCCFSNFKQHFAYGQQFTYRLEDIGRYYHDYVELMAHFDAVLPGRVHRVIYEAMVEDTEAEVRRLLEYCGLPFDERCLRFHENERAVRTASSEQVRQPIYRDGVDHWRHYDAWLDPLKAALGPVLAAYPATPQF